MSYEYSGYLRTLFDSPDPELGDELDYIEIDHEQLAKWSVRDTDPKAEWANIPVARTKGEDCVRLEGHFEDVFNIDHLDSDRPSYWVPLSSLGVRNAPFPIDLEKYPIAEITYRCISPNARPAWVWEYSGGFCLDGLFPSNEWRTVARKVSRFGFPKQVDNLVVRLYSSTRTTEALEIKSIRFRAMSEAEMEACERDARMLETEYKPETFPVLDDFFPVGVVMDAEASGRLADMLGLSWGDYWTFVFEDLVSHSHNCIGLEKAGALSKSNWEDILGLAETYGVKLVPDIDLAIGESREIQQQAIDRNVKPYVDSNSILAWSLRQDPQEYEFRDVLESKKLVYNTDQNHPAVMVTRDSSVYPLYAPFFAVMGLGHLKSRAPWELGPMVAAHLPLHKGQHFWTCTPAFVRGTERPEWSGCAEMRLMVNLALARGSKGIFAYRYHNEPSWIKSHYQRSLTGPFLGFSDLWTELGIRARAVHALAPLLAEAEPSTVLDDTMMTTALHEHAELPEGTPATNLHRLSGRNYDVYFLVSNDLHAMATVSVKTPNRIFPGLKMFSLSYYAKNRRWIVPRWLSGNIEMFPGQARWALVAKEEVCENWRKVITSKILNEDRRQLALMLRKARIYNLETGPAEELMADLSEDQTSVQDLQTMGKARETLIDVMYNSRDISATGTETLKTMAAICACDGALCRLLNRGKADRARSLGERVIPLARELMELRVRLRNGEGSAITEQCQSVSNRALGLLAEIRSSV